MDAYILVGIVLALTLSTISLLFGLAVNSKADVLRVQVEELADRLKYLSHRVEEVSDMTYLDKPIEHQRSVGGADGTQQLLGGMRFHVSAELRVPLKQLVAELQAKVDAPKTVKVPWPFAYGEGATFVPVEKALQMIIDAERYEWHVTQASEKLEKRT